MADKEGPTRILVVDDERIITMHLKDLLTNMNYSVVGTASSGEDAVEMARDLKPDIIFMDIIMPGKVNGIEAANRIRQDTNIPVIYITAFADDKILKKAKVSGPFGYIIKPFQGQELKAAIEIALYKKELEDKLYESELKYRMVVEESRDGIGIIAGERFAFINDTLLEMLGRPSEIFTDPYYHFFSDSYTDKLREIYAARMSGDDVAAINMFELNGPDGTSIPVEVNAKVITYRGEKAILGFFRRIDDQPEEKRIDELVHRINGRNQFVISMLEKMKMDDRCDPGELDDVMDALMENSGNLKSLYAQVRGKPTE